MRDTQVCIVGGGPVGMTLAMDLARRGVSVTLAEQNELGKSGSVRCNHVSARSMEIFHRLGLAQQIRDSGLPGDFPQDVAYRTTVAGIELCRVTIPARNDRFTATGGNDTWWPTPEPPHRINQLFMEPILAEAARNTAGLQVCENTLIERLEQGPDHVVAHGRDLVTGEECLIRAEYLVGCEGGSSIARACIGARFEGDAVVQNFQQTYIRSPQLIELFEGKPAWYTSTVNARRSGSVVAIDGHELWSILSPLAANGHGIEAPNRDLVIRTLLGVDESFEYEVLREQDFVGRRLVADKFREGRIFLAGDSAPIWLPLAGYGMNAGLADAEDLAWILSARLAGWAPPQILDAYDRERRLVTDQVSRYAMEISLTLQRQRSAVPAAIEEAGPQADKERQAFAEELYALGRDQYCCGGLNFGYFYDDSPIISYDGEAHPSYSLGSFTPSTVPGCRTPHVWLDDGRSLYDVLGPNYTLLRLDERLDVSPMREAASRRGVPLEVLDVHAQDAAVYDHALVLSRPDRHVAWRGQAVPEDPEELIDLVRGATGAR